jgi:aminomethyltransferase
MFDILIRVFTFKGNVCDQIQTLVRSDLSRLKPGQAQYTVFPPNPQRGIFIDDLILPSRGRVKARLG